MSVSYKAVQWNRHKFVYDAIAVGAMVLFIVVYAALTQTLAPSGEAPDPAVTLIRATGLGSIAMLHVLLVIGPLCRLWSRVLPLLYNRRHLGVLTFCVALLHGLAVTGYYHGFGEMNPLVSLLVNTARAEALPFEYYGILALLIMFVMAATSHDYWLKSLSPVWWKRVHMLVYAAYFLLVAHVGFGYLQGESGWISTALMAVGLITVVGLHAVAALKELKAEGADGSASEGWLDAGLLAEIPDGRAKVVCPSKGERIAVFKDGESVHAVTNVCAHQGGPLGEGKIVDGCVTCPWHGYQFRPEDGTSPPPYKEKIATYDVRVEGERVFVRDTPREGAGA